MDTIKDGSFGAAAVAAVAAAAAAATAAATAPPRRGSAFKKNTAVVDVFEHFVSLWAVLNRFGPFLDRLGPFSD